VGGRQGAFNYFILVWVELIALIKKTTEQILKTVWVICKRPLVKG